MSNLSDFVGLGETKFRPFQDLGTVTGSVDIDISEFGSFKVIQGNGDLTLNVIGDPTPEAFIVSQLFLYQNPQRELTINGASIGTFISPVLKLITLNITYDNKSFNINAQDTIPRGIDISPDGTKMYLCGLSSNSVHQYTLSTPFDLATASFANKSFSVLAQEAGPRGIRFSKDGSSFFIIGYSGPASTNDNPRIYKYNMTIPFDVSTASYANSSLGVGAQETLPGDLDFSRDGKFLYICGSGSDSIHQYNLSEPFEISTAIYSGNSFNVLDFEIAVASVAISDNGEEIYITGSGSDSITKFILQTPYDLSTLTLTGFSPSVAAQDGSPVSIKITNNENSIFILGAINDSVYQYSTVRDLSSDQEDYNFTQVITQSNGNLLLESKNIGYDLRGAL